MPNTVLHDLVKALWHSAEPPVHLRCVVALPLEKGCDRRPGPRPEAPSTPCRERQGGPAACPHPPKALRAASPDDGPPPSTLHQQKSKMSKRCKNMIWSPWSVGSKNRWTASSYAVFGMFSTIAAMSLSSSAILGVPNGVLPLLPQRLDRRHRKRE